MLVRFLILIILVLTANSCRKRDSLNWDSYWMAPVVHGRLDFSHLIEDELITVSSDSSLILDFEQEVFSITLDEFVAIPDTIVSNTFSSPVGGTFAENVEFIDEPQNFVFDNGNVSLAEAELSGGQITYEITSPIEKKTIVRYTIPSLTFNGQILELFVTVPGAPPGGISTVSGVVDLAGAHVDLRGVSGVDFNTLVTSLGVKVALGEGPATLSTSDVFEVKSSFENIVPQYAKGYFGHESITESNQTVANELLLKYLGGTIDIEELEVDFKLENGVGVDGRVTIDRLTAMNPTNGVFLNLQHDIIGQTININRAQDMNGVVQPTSFQRQFNQMNSNIESFFEVLPQYFAYDAELEVNPLGNIANGNDFAYGSSAVSAVLDVHMPLCLIANQLTLQDTLTVQIDNNGNVQVKTVELDVRLDNNFPFELSPQLFLLDDTGIISDTLIVQNISSAALNTYNQVVASTSWREVIMLDESQTRTLINNGRLVVRMSLTTASPGDHVKIKSNHYMDVDIRAKAKVHSSL